MFATTAAGQRAKTGLDHPPRVEDPERIERGLDRAHHARPRPRRAARRASSRRDEPDPVLAVTVPPSSIAASVQVRRGQPRSARRPAGRRARRRSSGGGCRRRRGRTSPIRTPCRSPIASIARSRSGTRLRGTPMSSIWTVADAARAPGSASRRRLAQPVGLRSDRRAHDGRRARRPRRRARPRRSSSAAAASPGRSDSISSIAAASRSRPRWCMSSTARIVNWSISSSVTGGSPAAVDPGDRLARRLERREEGEQRRARRRRRPQPQRRLGDDAQRPLRPDEEVRQRVAGDVLDVLAAGPDDASRRP